MIADDDARIVLLRDLEHAAAVGPAVDEVAHERQPLPGRVEARRVQQLHELLVATLYVANHQMLLYHANYCNRSPGRRIQ